MAFISTRGDGEKLTASRSILKGIADDGGLYVPEEIPKGSYSPADLAQEDYNAHALWVLKQYLRDYTPRELEHCIKNAYSDTNFDSPEIAPVTNLPHVSFLELYHGRTSAFKDIALSILPYLMTHALKKTHAPKKQVILTATSGDTGISALAGFKDVPDMKIIVFYPENGVSVIQKQHMITQTGANVHVLGVKGNFDDAQSEVKRIFLDNAMKERLATVGYEFSSANSINTGRLLPQIVYYFYAYSQLIKGGMSPNEPVNFVVPTGNFGNILAGYYAKKMGLPINKLICASNENKVLFDFFATGDFNANRKFYLTTSPSMDILLPSNFERLIYDLRKDESSGLTQKLEKLSNQGKYSHGVALEDFVGYYASEPEVWAAIKKVYTQYDYLIDSHTAVAYVAYEKHIQATSSEEKTVIISTASPYKFPKTVMSSIDDEYAEMDDFALIEKISEITGKKIPPHFVNLQEKQVLHETVVETQDMKEAVAEILGV